MRENTYLGKTMKGYFQLQPSWDTSKKSNLNKKRKKKQLCFLVILSSRSQQTRIRLQLVTHLSHTNTKGHATVHSYLLAGAWQGIITGGCLEAAPELRDVTEGDAKGLQSTGNCRGNSASAEAVPANLHLCLPRFLRRSDKRRIFKG